MYLRRPTRLSAFDTAHWLRDFPKDLVSALRDVAQTRTLACGQRMSDIGDTSVSLIGVDEGFLAVHTDDAQAQDVIAHIFGRGDWFGVAGVLSDTPRIVGSSALTDARITQISKPAIERIAEAYPLLWRGMAVISARNTQVATRMARDVLIKSPADRCAATLDRLVGAQPLPCALPLTQTQLADICGLSRGTVARVLSEFESAGSIVRGYASITVRSRLLI